MEDLRRDLIRRHKITESEMRRFNQGFKKYVAANSEMTEQQLVEFVRPQVAKARAVAAGQSAGRTPSPRVSSDGQPVIVRTSGKKKSGITIGFIAIAAFLLIAVGFCRKNTNENLSKESKEAEDSSQKAVTVVVTEEPFPDEIKIDAGLVKNYTDSSSSDVSGTDSGIEIIDVADNSSGLFENAVTDSDGSSEGN